VRFVPPGYLPPPWAYPMGRAGPRLRARCKVRWTYRHPDQWHVRRYQERGPV